MLGSDDSSSSGSDDGSKSGGIIIAGGGGSKSGGGSIFAGGGLQRISELELVPRRDQLVFEGDPLRLQCSLVGRRPPDQETAVFRSGISSISHFTV